MRKGPEKTNWEVIIASTELEFCEIASIDGNLVSFQKESRFALQIISGNEYFDNVPTSSVRSAIINVASIGLTLNPAMKLAYLVPRKGVACLDISYIGLVKIATDSGSVSAVKAEIVREKDGFKYNGPFVAPTHDFDPFATAESRGPIKGCYSMALLPNGTTVVDTLSNEEITKIRSMSKAKTGPWFDWEEEMIKKSVIKRGSKLWPRSERLAMAEKILNEHEGNEIDITPTGAPPKIARPNAAQIAQDAQFVQPSEEGDRLIADLELISREQGAKAFEETWRALPRAKRALVGINNRDRIYAMGA